MRTEDRTEAIEARLLGLLELVGIKRLVARFSRSSAAAERAEATAAAGKAATATAEGSNLLPPPPSI